MLALMAVNVLSNFATGRAYWDVSPPAAEKARVEREEAEKALSRALELDEHARAVVAHETREPERSGVLVHRRPEADALDMTGDVYIEGNVFGNYIKDEFNTDPGESNTISASGTFSVPV